ncbi:hypothetical protein PYV02_06770 [Leifsonia sp. H3M29-4]|uniref:hypothetical protein n=1 Tax=Salinibacterium metalliresistens TaxID=3031321 RepID=UPI0023DBF6F7|nr:hypothetical protein [Salinibacterium metalliresistens]MDF1478786.1 hypothetical protein [Salinibacterium metalliresistens]
MIVVIAILAAVTIVAYNGISKRAKASTAQSAAQQIAKKIATYAITNGEDYPSDLATIGVTDDGSTSYQYSVNNSASPRTYCVTVSVSDISYFISSTQQSPTEGGCPGHGQGGVASITNLAVNPSFEAGSSTIEVRRNLTRYPNAEMGTTAGWGPSAGSTISSVSELAHSGTRSYKVVTPGVATSEGISQAGSAAMGPASSGVATAETLSVWVHAPAGATLYSLPRSMCRMAPSLPRVGR